MVFTNEYIRSEGAIKFSHTRPNNSNEVNQKTCETTHLIRLGAITDAVRLRQRAGNDANPMKALAQKIAKYIPIKTDNLKSLSVLIVSSPQMIIAGAVNKFASIIHSWI